MSDKHDTSHIIQSLVANAAIAAFKGGAAALTGSGSLLAETLHSASDCGNQLLLLLGVRRSAQPPDQDHPLGHGRALYFWSFVVALLLFCGGGVFSVYEGIHKLMAPEPVERVWLGFLVLGVSLLIEGWATLGNVRQINKRRGDRPFIRYLRETKDSDLIVVFGENAAASLGLLVALAAFGTAAATGDGRWDALGSICIGLILIGVAVFLATEVKSLIVGESADAVIETGIRATLASHPQITALMRLITIQQGPGEVLVAMKVRMRHDLTTDELCHAINEFERDLHKSQPDIKWCFVEPDTSE